MIRSFWRAMVAGMMVGTLGPNTPTEFESTCFYTTS